MVAAGGLLLVLGALTYWGAFSWFGRLPGDIRVESESTRFYFPVVSMIVVSVVLSLLATLLRRLL
jgi:hypothetical protein